MNPEAEAASWDRAALALRLLGAAGSGLGGAVVRMRAGPARQAVLERLSALSPRRIHPGISDAQLFGGLDLAATLQSHQIIETKSFFDTPGTIVLTMAERCGRDLAAKLAQELDREAGHLLVALDEGVEPDEATPPSLAERLALSIAPEGRMPEGWPAVPAGTGAADGPVAVAPEDIETLTTLAAAFGIDSLRAPVLALRVARAHAALHGRRRLTRDDLRAAAELTYPQRATMVPQEPETGADDTPPPPPPEPPDSATQDDSRSGEVPDGDLLVEAVRALLPPDLLAGLVAGGSRGGSSGAGAGQRRKGNRRGRPLPPRPGRLDGRARIDLVATLRAAAPWQPLRMASVPAGTPVGTGLRIRPADIRLKRFEEHSDRLLVFAVDASGSAAMARLNEAKGAVELLLGQAYAARDHVALIAFRGTGADLLLPPTRSLVQTKRRLASLPGGGGTPLAAGLQAAAHLAHQSRARGLSPTVILLTDGRANIALDGRADRTAAQTDAEAMARLLRAEGFGALVIDTSRRPQEPLRALSGLLGAKYVAMPRADAERLTGAVSAALGR